MLRAYRLFATLLLAGLLGACVGPVPKVEANQAELAKLSTVDVIRPPERKLYTVLNIGHPGMAFGLIGGIIAAADMNSKQERLSAVLSKEQLGIPTALSDKLVAGLGKEGYKVKAVDAPWVEQDGRISLRFENIQSEADAVLVVLPTMVGFVDGGMVNSTGGAYAPTITLVVSLLGKDRKTVLYRGYHATGWKPMAEGWRHTPNDARYPNFDDLMAKPELTAASLLEASDLVARTVMADLQRTPAGTAATASADAPPVPTDTASAPAPDTATPAADAAREALAREAAGAPPAGAPR